MDQPIDEKMDQAINDTATEIEQAISSATPSGRWDAKAISVLAKSVVAAYRILDPEDHLEPSAVKIKGGVVEPLPTALAERYFVLAAICRKLGTPIPDLQELKGTGAIVQASNALDKLAKSQQFLDGVESLRQQIPTQATPPAGPKTVTNEDRAKALFGE